jgi:hypothetical protein
VERGVDEVQQSKRRPPPRAAHSSIDRIARAALLAMSASALAGCDAAFNAGRQDLIALHAAGNYEQAAAILDDPKTIADYGEKNRLLYWMERGAVALAQDDDAKAIDTLNKADDYMEILRKSTAGDELGKWLLNDTAAPYYGASYENMYVGVLKLLAHLEAGRIDGGATVEARRLAGKSDFLRDQYVRAIETFKNDPEYADARQALGDRIDSTTEGQFIESTLGTYLTAVTFMKSGESSLQDVAGRRLQSSLTLQHAMQSRVNETNFADIGQTRSSQANVLLVGLSGRGPIKEPERFGPIPIYTYTVYFEVPRLVSGPAQAAGVRVLIERASADPSAPTSPDTEPSTPPVAAPDLSLIEDLGIVAEENFRRELPAIYTRSLIRSSAKAAAWAVGTEAARRGTSNDESAQATVEILGVIGGLLFVTQTEKADLRCWSFLPGQAHVGLLRLDPGAYRARFQYLTNTGETLYQGPWKLFTVMPGDSALTTLVDHWWE